MLLPRFSIRWLLALIFVAAVFFYIVTLANQAYPSAIAVVIATSSLVLLVAVYAGLFLVAWVLSSIAGLARSGPKAKSPFATDAPPPQMIPPEDPV